MTFNECLKKYDPEGKLTRAQIDYIKKFYEAGKAFSKEEGKLEYKPLVERVIEYFNSQTGRSLTASAGTVKLLTPRIKSGYKEEDFNHIVDYAVAEWTGTKFAQYIKPTVLWGSDEKMDKYLECFEAWYNRAAPKEEEVKPKNDGWQEVGF